LHLGNNVHHSKGAEQESNRFWCGSEQPIDPFLRHHKTTVKYYAISLKTTLGLRWIPLLYEPIKPVCE